MKKYFILFIYFIFICVICFYPNIKSEDDDITVMNEIRTYNTAVNEYELVFDDEVLNLSNFKLKMAIFSSSECNIRKVYIYYANNVKEYFKDKEYISVTGNNLNYIIDLVREKYNNVLKENNVYEEGYTDNNISINKVVVQGDAEVINKFKMKYPNVKVMTK